MAAHGDDALNLFKPKEQTMKANRRVETPGEERERIEVPEGEDGADISSRVNDGQLNNITGKSPNEVALDREVEVRNRANAIAAANGRTADLAPPSVSPGDVELERRRAALKPRKVMINGEEVEVVVPNAAQGVNPQVQKYGVESRHAKGTLVRKDGTACPDGEKPYGVIGDIKTEHGWLLRRVIPLEATQAS